MFAFSSIVLTRFPLHERAGAAVNVGEEPRAAYPRRVAARPLVEIGRNEVTRSEANLEAKRLLKSKPSGAREPTASLPLSRPLFDARAAALLGRRCGGTPFVPTPPFRRGAQRRARGFSGDPAARSDPKGRGGSWGGTPLPGVSTGALSRPRSPGCPRYPRTAATNYREAIGTNYRIVRGSDRAQYGEVIVLSTGK